VKDDLRLALRAVRDPGRALPPRVERLAALAAGGLLLAGAVATYLALGSVARTGPADAGVPGVVITPSTTSRQ
jgi:hypothetical protein